jgi:hypothetical protein
MCWRRGCWKVTGPEVEKVRRYWRKLDNEELHDLYITPDTIMSVESRTVRNGLGMWQVQERITVGIIFWREGLKERDHLKNQDVDGKVEQKCILQELG